MCYSRISLLSRKRLPKTTEERKHAILFAATLLCARKIIGLVDAPDHEKMGRRHWIGVFEKEGH